MEPHEIETFIRHLIGLAALQSQTNERHELDLQELRLISQHLQVTSQQQELTNQRLTVAIERIGTTLDAIKDLLGRGPNGR